MLSPFTAKNTKFYFPTSYNPTKSNDCNFTVNLADIKESEVVSEGDWENSPLLWDLSCLIGTGV